MQCPSKDFIVAIAKNKVNPRCSGRDRLFINAKDTNTLSAYQTLLPLQELLPVELLHKKNQSSQALADQG